MPLYLGNTKIDKFTAKIEGGAASLEGNLTVITPPTKLVYDVGDSFDPRGMKVVATIGGLEVPVGSYTVSPDPLVAGTTEVVLTYELDGKTATGTQSITVNEWNPILEQNSWAQIADAAAKGRAKEFWNIGDTKHLSIDGEQYVVMIVDFDYYNLATTDTKYATNYNGGSNKAGITFMLSQVYDTKVTANYYFYTSNSLSTAIDKIGAKCSDLTNIVRSVNAYAYNGGNAYDFNKTFLCPSYYELHSTGSSYIPRFAWGTNSKKLLNRTGTACEYLLRDVNTADKSIRFTDSNGNASTYSLSRDPHTVTTYCVFVFSL